MKWFRKFHRTGEGVPELETVRAAGDAFRVDCVRVYGLVEWAVTTRQGRRH